MAVKNSNVGKNKKIRHNKYAQTTQAELDLHGFTIIEAKEALENFLNNTRNKKYKRIRIITGKGLHSKSGQSILGEYVKNILEKEGLKYSDAKIYEGGSGAINVQLYVENFIYKK